MQYRNKFSHTPRQIQQLGWLNQGCGFDKSTAAPEAASDACGGALAQVHPTHAITICVHTQAKQDLEVRSPLLSGQVG